MNLKSKLDWKLQDSSKNKVILLLYITSAAIIGIWGTTCCYCTQFNCCFIRCLHFLGFHFAGLKRKVCEEIRIWSSFYRQKAEDRLLGIPIILYFWENLRWWSMNEFRINERFYATLRTFLINFWHTILTIEYVSKNSLENK